MIDQKFGQGFIAGVITAVIVILFGFATFSAGVNFAERELGKVEVAR